MDVTSLTRTSTISEMVACAAHLESVVVSSFSSLQSAIDHANVVFGDVAHLSHDIGVPVNPYRLYDTYAFSAEQAEHAVMAVRKQIWRKLVERLELRRAMSIARFKELEREMNDGKTFPAITEESIHAFVAKHSAALPEMLSEMVAEVYDWLRPTDARSHKAQYKSNRIFEVGPRVVLSWMVSFQFGKWSVRYEEQQHLTALENIFSALDGHGQISKEHYSVLSRHIKESNGRGETEYFGFRCFQNRNLHLMFLRADLLAKFNQLAGGARLKPEAA